MNDEGWIVTFFTSTFANREWRRSIMLVKRKNIVYYRCDFEDLLPYLKITGKERVKGNEKDSDICISYIIRDSLQRCLFIPTDGKEGE